jgi:hypothetical protein
MASARWWLIVSTNLVLDVVGYELASPDNS